MSKGRITTEETASETIRRTEPDWTRIRSEFPALLDWNYLNTATYGHVPQRSTGAVADHFARRNRLACSDFLEWFDDMDRVRAVIGRLLNCSGEDVAFAPTAASALSLLLGGIDWRPGDRILTLRDEFPNQYYYPKWLGPRGVELIETAEISSVPERTRAILASTVSYATGYRPDLVSMSRLAREAGALLYLDATQSAGALGLDLESIQPDMCAVDPYKWLLAPNGAAFFYVHPKLRERLEPQVFGWRSDKRWRDVDDLSSERPCLSGAAERYEGGMLNFPSLYGLGESIRFILEIGPNEIERRVLWLASETADALERLGARIAHRDSNIVCGYWETADASALRRELHQTRIVVAARRGALRVSPHFYNNEDDIRALESAISKILPRFT